MTDRPRPTRGRPSRVQQLPPKIKAKLDELLRAGVTQTKILDQLAPLLEAIGERPLSYSSLNRYTTRMEAVGRRLREVREVTEAWTARVGEKASNIGAYTIEMLGALIYDLTLDAHEGAVDVEKVQELALAVQRIERASHLNASRERALRKEIADLAADEAKKAAAAEAEKSGHVLPPQALRAIREQVYGIVDPA